MKVNAADKMRQPCEGAGQPADSDSAVIFGVGRCPECYALATVDDETGKIDPHTVLIIDCGGDDDLEA
jgi:hypothetical protein